MFIIKMAEPVNLHFLNRFELIAKMIYQIVLKGSYAPHKWLMFFNCRYPLLIMAKTKRIMHRFVVYFLNSNYFCIIIRQRDYDRRKL